MHRLVYFTQGKYIWFQLRVQPLMGHDPQIENHCSVKCCVVCYLADVEQQICGVSEQLCHCVLGSQVSGNAAEQSVMQQKALRHLDQTGLLKW